MKELTNHEWLELSEDFDFDLRGAYAVAILSGEEYRKLIESKR